jgi:Domain of unknown function (DUF4082)
LRSILAIAILTASLASAANLYSDAGGGNDRTGDGFSLGSEFTVSASGLTVIALGIYDFTGNALITDHEVGLWDLTAGDVLPRADVTVAAGTSNGGVPGFLFVALGSGVALTNGDTYILGAYYPTGSSTDRLLDCCQGAAPTMDPAFTAQHGVYSTSAAVGSLSEPTNIVAHAYVGPNLQFQPAPEPGTAALTFMAVAALSAYSFRRRWSQ